MANHFTIACYLVFDGAYAYRLCDPQKYILWTGSFESCTAYFGIILGRLRSRNVSPAMFQRASKHNDVLSERRNRALPETTARVQFAPQ